MIDLVTPLWEYMHTREQVRLARKQGLPKPWTQDPILQSYRFCNVNREHDTVTQWIRLFIRGPYAEHKDLWFLLAIARVLNLPGSLNAVIEAGLFPPHDNPTGDRWWDPESFAQLLRERRRRKQPWHTGAYMVRAAGRNQPYADDKAGYVTHVVLDGLWRQREELRSALWGTSLQEATHRLTSFYGWGGFMAYEVVTDLRHTAWLHGAPDIYTWANAGPGAKRGLNRLHGRPVAAPLSQTQACDEMRALLEALTAEIPGLRPGSLCQRYGGPDNAHRPTGWSWTLEMRDVEHSLCEFDKYERVRLGEGAPRSRYPGGRGQ